ncbi:hypothetical protein Q4575_01230 [Psychrosphaera sp. 1_MG-2023]|uniref:hypothetical protein n=1 Tax=Psychrosphaera sp. 1_MG-2023 TaxID=3062643 RepID=UPI0026E1688F|nr:hypothetical protein [Psychrosphaera sp. 1_MG-2023]MDO6718000.1 hypothetical protein [Psychrosphaera sp. 1_MG-2023]
MANQAVLLNYHYDMVKAKSHSAGHLSVPLTNITSFTDFLLAQSTSLSQLETLTKLLSIALFNDLNAYVDVKTRLDQLTELDGLYLVNRYQHHIKPVIFVTTELTDFVFKKLHNKANLVNVTAMFNQTVDTIPTDKTCTKRKTPNLTFICKSNSFPEIDFNKRVSLDCYLEHNQLSVVVNKLHYIDFEVVNLRKIEDLLITSLLADAG